MTVTAPHALTGLPHQSDLSDEALVDLVRAGEIAQFAVLMRRYNRRLFRAVRSIVIDDSEAEDVVQAAYVSAYEHLEHFAGAARFSTWLTRIAVHEALGRTRRRRRRGELVLLDDVPPAELVWEEPTPEDAVADRELTRVLEAAVDELPEIYRVAFVLRDVEGMSTGEVAAALSIREDALRVRLHRARTLLRAALERRLGAATASLYSFDGERCDRIVQQVMERIAGA